MHINTYVKALLEEHQAQKPILVVYWISHLLITIN